MGSSGPLSLYVTLCHFVVLTRFDPHLDQLFSCTGRWHAWASAASWARKVGCLSRPLVFINQRTWGWSNKGYIRVKTYIYYIKWYNTCIYTIYTYTYVTYIVLHAYPTDGQILIANRRTSGEVRPTATWHMACFLVGLVVMEMDKAPWLGRSDRWNGVLKQIAFQNTYHRIIA